MRFEYKKKFGQNFISDRTLLEEIADLAEVKGTDTVLEIGAGMGALTEQLSKRALRVVSFEIDEELKPILQSKFCDSNVQLVFADIMRTSDAQIDALTMGDFVLVANLPYYVTSPILCRFLRNPNLRAVTVMVQKEVADRICAKAHTGEYSLLSVICGLFGKARQLKFVGRENFFPVPSVDSAIVRIEREPREIRDYEGLINFVKRAFSQKRKKLSTNLATKDFSKGQAEALLASLNFSPLVRAEELTVDDFCLLYDSFCQISSK